MRGTYNKDSQIKFKTSMLTSSLCDYGYTYIPVTGTITITGDATNENPKGADERDKEVIFENRTPFTECISEVNNTQTDNTQKDIDVVMPRYNLIEYSNNFTKTSGTLWQYYRDEPNDNVTNSESFQLKIKNKRKNC